MNGEVQQLIDAGKLSPGDAVKLQQFEPGTFVQHKSWGVGRVAQWDLLGERLLIDFEGKAGHGLKLSFALGSLEVLPADHLLARFVADPDAVRALAPAALVELALRSSGNRLAADQLESLLKPRIIPEARYKTWWDAAKKELKSVRHIVLPAKRQEPLILRESSDNHGELMVADFIARRDLKGKLTVLASIAKDLGEFSDAARDLVPMLADLSQAVTKAYRLNLRESLQLLLARDELIERVEGLRGEPQEVTVAWLIAQCRDQVGEAASSLPASLVGRFYRAFPHAFAQDGAWVPELLKHFSQANARAMGELAAVFVDHGQRAAFDEALAKAVRNRTAGMEVLMWACRERAGLASSAFGIDLAHAVLDCIEHDHVSGGPKRTGRMVEMLGAEESLIAQWVSQPGEEAVVGFIKRLLGTAALEELTRRSLMARVIRQRPEYEEVMAQRVSSKEDDALLVSWESLERKKAELQELVSVKIPHNNQEIQIAREEGDLRENGGYKAARDQQAVLNRMRDQLEREIGRARGTDFANVSTQVAGIGTVVTYLDLASGEQHQMTILGAWDSDLQHHVVSYLSEIAKAVTGKAVGEEAQLPGDHGPQQVRVLAITAYAKGA